MVLAAPVPESAAVTLSTVKWRYVVSPYHSCRLILIKCSNSCKNSAAAQPLRRSRPVPDRTTTATEATLSHGSSDLVPPVGPRPGDLVVRTTTTVEAVVVVGLRRGLVTAASAVTETEGTVAIAIAAVVTTTMAVAAATVVTTTTAKATTSRPAALRRGSSRHLVRSTGRTPATPAILPTVVLLAWVPLRACLQLRALEFLLLLLDLEGLTLSSSSTPGLLRHPRPPEALEMLLLPLPLLLRLAMCPRLLPRVLERLRQLILTTNLGTRSTPVDQAALMCENKQKSTETVPPHKFWEYSLGSHCCI
jgi:hypothetical protein